MRLELIKLFVSQTLQKLGVIPYPSLQDNISYDPQFDVLLASILMKRLETQNDAEYISEVNKLIDHVIALSDHKQQSIDLNCWQMVLLINLSIDPLALFNQEIDDITDTVKQLADKNFSEGAYQAFLGFDQVRPITAEIKFGSTVFIMGLAHVCLYTQNNKVLSQWATVTNEKKEIKDKLHGLKEVAIDDLIEYTLSSPQMARDSLSNLLKATNSPRQTAIIEKMIDFKYAEYFHGDLPYTEEIQKQILKTLKDYKIPLVYYSPPMFNDEKLAEQLDLTISSKKEIDEQEKTSPVRGFGF